MNNALYEATALRGFFENELKNNLLSFWLQRCVDEENGGYVNCFSNDGVYLVSKDKYAWSQGRFLWIFSRLARTESRLFSPSERKRFLTLAQSGRDFLMRHVLIAPGDYRCIFLMNADGSPKYADGADVLDASIYADYFVSIGMSQYALAANDRESWEFAKHLYESVWDRYQSGRYKSLPYPLSPRYQAHAKPMFLNHISCEMHEAALRFEPAYADGLKDRIRQSANEVFDVFMDQNGFIHENKDVNGQFPPNLFGEHINPGHIIEDMWFQVLSEETLGRHDLDEKIALATLRALNAGWDPEYGGVFHFVSPEGHCLHGDPGDAANEPQMSLITGDWGSKLWWVHSECLYTTLLLYDRLERQEFLDWFRTIFQYTFATFPNPDQEIREWIQIRTREGKPQEKVVCLPVKDPFHIMRDVVLILELLDRRIEKLKAAQQ